MFNKHIRYKTVHGIHGFLLRVRLLKTLHCFNKILDDIYEKLFLTTNQ